MINLLQAANPNLSYLITASSLSPFNLVKPCEGLLNPSRRQRPDDRRKGNQALFVKKMIYWTRKIQNLIPLWYLATMIVRADS